MNYLKTYFFDIIFKNYFNAAGRATRKEFWFFTLNAFILVSFVTIAFGVYLAFLFSTLKQTLANPMSVESFSTMPFKLGYVIAFLVIAIPFLLAFPHLNLIVRRLHDINFSSWWLFLFFLPEIGALIIFVFMCLPGTKGANKYDVEPGTKKFGFVSLAIILISLSILLFFIFIGKYAHDKIEERGEIIIDKIAQAELKYFEQNNDFLYIDKTDSNDILNINLQDNMIYNEFSCTKVTGMEKTFTLEDKSSKQVEIRVWEKTSKRDEKFGREKYKFVIMNDKGTKTEIDTKISYKKAKEMIEGKQNNNDNEKEQ